ncbi:50S ribosomal protein L11 methyltransferase [Capnocytophaga catalasegens]|uniref:Ribosomal protein L11 methyltransferase n=1 Tax=Capnocytophaga catalasegens TaxID=1004260 RepID=A0AAV5AY47_9FLAO|nr:50S ribosomal protein L11 methyltransferase [Capnocytophaga catalasegens]GIZ14563.1 ribosomal protein L11 methyltransferase [Capnocytophaga catalasegens]GJM50765.1 ribosomal protein L11 methyltransferase [Capnocytophaga catalasegens]GJM51918.1 ribosomal protein L11 methyltransferase [Capnocytophaga catalasegens]
MTNYIEYIFDVNPIEGAEILIAELGEVGFESFVETECGVSAYIQKDLWNDDLLSDIFILTNPDFSISYQMKEIEQVNWNEEWEKNFSPIVVDDICSVRATFHPKPNTKYDIIIDPKMSFGTGHHETTHMMLQHILRMKLNEKKVLDMGCGTGILAIMAAHRGATDIQAIDIDDWCCQNATENISHNGFDFISVEKGDASLLAGRSYDLIIANINRNILLEDIPTYVKSLNPKGTLLLSGFFIEDLIVITQKCEDNGLQFVESIERNRWISALYTL